MLFISAPHVVQAELKFRVGTDFAENIFNFRVANLEPTQPDCQDVCETLEAWYLTYYKPKQSGAVEYIGITAKGMYQREAAMHEFTPLETVNGGSVSPIMPMNVTMAMNLKTGLAGRSCRGRNYIVGLTESECVGDGITAQARDDYLAAWAHLIQDAMDHSLTWVVVSRYFNGLPRTEAVTFPITTITCKPLVCSQKRRLSGRGA